MKFKSLVFILPPFLATEEVEVDVARDDSSCYTSRIQGCCT